MHKLMMAVMMATAVGCCSNQANAEEADAYDALLAHIDYLEREAAVWGELKETIDSGLFASLSDASQVGADYASAMAPPPPYDDGSVEMAVTDALDLMIAASQSLSDALQKRVDASNAAMTALDFQANGQYDAAVATFQSAVYDDMTGFGIFTMDLLSLGDAVDNANYWLANWPQDPEMGMP